MPRYSRKSLDKLGTCDPDLQKLFNKVIEEYDCTIIEGLRSMVRQNKLYKEGSSKLKGGESKHNLSPSLAVDVAPYPIDWEDKTRFYHFVGYVKGVADSMGIKIRCGADWDGDNGFRDQKFHDLPHFELKD